MLEPAHQPRSYVSAVDKPRKRVHGGWLYSPNIILTPSDMKVKYLRYQVGRKTNRQWFYIPTLCNDGVYRDVLYLWDTGAAHSFMAKDTRVHSGLDCNTLVRLGSDMPGATGDVRREYDVEFEWSDHHPDFDGDNVLDGCYIGNLGVCIGEPHADQARNPLKSWTPGEGPDHETTGVFLPDPTYQPPTVVPNAHFVPMVPYTGQGMGGNLFGMGGMPGGGMLGMGGNGFY